MAERVPRLTQWVHYRGGFWSVGILLMLLIGQARTSPVAGLARADEPTDAALPAIEPKELAARLRAAWAAYDKGLLEITFETTRNVNWRFMMKQGKAADQEPILVQFPGRVRFLGAGRLWRVEYDSMMPTSLSKKLNPYGFRSGFDGEQLYGLDLMRNVAALGETTWGAENWKPRDQFWHNGKSFADALDEPPTYNNTITIGQRTVDGFRCYVVQRTYARAGTRTEEIVSPRQGYLLINTVWSRKGRVYHTHSLRDLHQVSPGFWAPSQMMLESLSVHDDGAEQLDQRTESRIVRYEPAKTFADDSFAFTPPYGVDVTDRRVGYSYHNDPWWSEMARLLRDRFDWPKSDLSPLSSLGSPAKFTGRSAPPISAETWINSKPLELAQLKGKVVLVEFWGTWCPPCREKIPAMRTLYETYHGAGLEIISIHTPTDDVNDVRRFVHEYRMPYPIAIDTAGKDQGVTSGAYGVTGYPCAFLVDHEGNVHLIGEATPDGGRLVETLVPLLEKAGAKDVSKISLAHPPLPDEVNGAIREALPKWLAAAPQDSAVRGRIVDGHGQPIVGAKLNGQLKLTLLMFATPGGYQTVAQGRQFPAACREDGRFEVNGLNKGNYELRFEAAGRASVERNVAIGPDLKVAELKIVLDQGDTIAGIVHDPQGKPIAGAEVDPTKWHHRNLYGGEVFTSPSGVRAVRSDEAGLFDLHSLRHGGYTLVVTAPGFKTHEIATVPSGTVKVEVTLERARSSTPANP